MDYKLFKCIFSNLKYLINIMNLQLISNFIVTGLTKKIEIDIFHLVIDSII